MNLKLFFEVIMRFLKALFGGGSSKETKSDPSVSKAKNTKPVRKLASLSEAIPPKARVISDLKSFPFNIAGESNYQDALEEIASGYRRDSQAVLVTALVMLDPENRYDPNAVRVEIEGQTVGYIPKIKAKLIGEMMQAQGVRAATVEAQVRGGWRTNQHDQGHFGVRLKMPQSGWIDFGTGAKKPKSIPSVPRSKNSANTPAANGPLATEKIALWGFTKDGVEAQDIARAGGKIMAGVVKSTTIVVRNNGPITLGMQASATWKKLEELQANGHNIELITWSEIQSRIATTQTP